MSALKQIRVESGRLDQLIVGCAELVCRGYIEPRLRGLPLWDRGVGQVVQQLVVDAGVPSTPVTAVDVARMVGVLRPGPRVVVDNTAEPVMRRRRWKGGSRGVR